MNLKIVERNQTLGAALRDIARLHPRREAIVLGDQRVTYGELSGRVAAVAAGLRRLGVGRGDKVALILPNCLEFVYVAFAAADIGAAAVPMSMQSRAHEVGHILTDCEAVAVVTDIKAFGNDLLAMLAELRPTLPHLQHVIVKGQPDAAASISSGIIPFDDLLRSSPEPVAAEIQPTDPAMILYTSGTTGAPKGAVHSHRTLLMALRLLIAKYRKEMMPSWPLVKNILPALKTVRRVPWLGEVMLTLVDLAQIKLLILTPFYHIAGYFQIVLGVLAGCKLVVLERFHPERALELIRRERVTLVVGVPPMYQAMLERENFARFDLSSVVLMVTTAMATPPQLVRDLRDRIGGFIVIIYGATEIAATTVTVPTDASDKQTDTVGRVAMNGVEVRIVDDQRREVPRGAMGEIAVRAPSMMEGYYKRPDATAEVIDQDGWYYTGDMGQLDAEGYVTVLGRRGDMIIRAGVNVYPAEIENYLLTHPKISQVAVIGLPGPASSGERVVAYVVPKEGDVMEAGDVLAYCWGQIAAFKVPDEVRFVKELPVTSALQKVQHYKLRQQALTEGHQGDNV